MKKNGLIITIDGPAGAGKSSVSKSLARQLNYAYIDTGAMYRAVAYAARRAGIDWQDAGGIAALLKELTIAFGQVEGQNHLFLNGEDVEQEIRSHEISKGASEVSAHPAVREHLLGFQRASGERGGAILEGRDTGSVVFPDADLKFFLDASAQQRANRRYEQMGSPQEQSVEEIQRDIEQRDRADRQRDVAPLCCPADAISIDSSTISLENVVAQMMKHVQDKLDAA